MAVKRLCGFRVVGGIYIECGLSPYGSPLEHFLIDPPKQVDKERIGLTPVGLFPFKHKSTGDTVHVMDWVGEQYYPTAPDFLDEVRELGLSRRIARTFDFNLLTPASRIFIVHPKGYIGNHQDIYQLMGTWDCPSDYHNEAEYNVPELELPRDMCINLLWQVRDRGTAIKPSHSPALVASFPISNLAVIRDPEEASHEEAVEAASKSSLTVTLEEA